MFKSLVAVSLFGMLCSQAQAAELLWRGDVRYRHELNSDGLGTTNGKTVSNVHRLMFRGGANAKLNDSTEAEFRLGTGGGRTSLNQTLGASNSSFANYDIKLDRAFFIWKRMDMLAVMGGRHRNTFFMAGGSDMIWDSDLNFDGLTASGSMGAEDMRFFVNTGVHFLNSSTTSLPDQYLLSLQLGSKMKLGETELGVGAGIYNYTDMAGRTVPSPATNIGNSTTTTVSGTTSTVSFNNDYRILNAGVEAVHPLMGMPVGILFDYANNMAITAENTAWLAGLKIGKTKKEGDWYFGYDYRTVQKDAVVAQFADGDGFLGQGTNGKGHRIRAAYSVADPMVITLTALLGKTGIADGETEARRNRGQLDLTFSF